MATHGQPVCAVALPWWLALFSVILCAWDAQATDIAQDESAVLARATGHFQRGEFEPARVLIKPLLDLPEPPLQALFLQAQLARASGDCGAAIDGFRAMLARDATLARPRIDLGLTLWECGRGHEALAQFSRVLDMELPRDVARQLAHLAGALRKETGGFRLFARLVQDSNAAQVGADSVNIRGVRYELDDASKPIRATGISLGAEWMIPLSAGAREYFAGVAENTDFPGARADFAYVQSALGTRKLAGAHEIKFEAGGHFARYQQRLLYRGLTWHLGADMKGSDTWRFGANVDGKQLNYADRQFQNRDGWQYSLGLFSRWAVAETSALEFNLNHTHSSAADSSFSFSGPSASVAIAHETGSGWQFALRLEAAAFRYGREDGLFGIRRVDRRSNLELALAPPVRLRIWGATPALVIGKSIVASTIELYRFQRNYLNLTWRKEF